MLFQPILDNFECVVFDSSQTTSGWPLDQLGEEEIINYSLRYDIGGPNIEYWGEEDWEEAIDEVFSEYADAWRRLADL